MQLNDPREIYAKPPFDGQATIKMPGRTAEMTPTPDHGEQSYQGSGKLQGLSALVTGSDSGIGRAVALCYAREGANVAISYLSEASDAEETAELVREAGVKAAVISGDLQDECFCKKLVDRTVDELGTIDIAARMHPVTARVAALDSSIRSVSHS